MRKLLIPFSFLYWIGVSLRNWFFDKGIFRTTFVSVPVVSVGNISSGGSGKTPLVEMLIRKLSENRKVSVVSRGYKRISSGQVVVCDGKGFREQVERSGDEPSQFAAKFPESIVVADEDRVRGARKAIELGADVILLDDGFQHRALGRKSNIAVLTAEELLRGDLLLPAGNRREPMSALKRADLIVISRCSGKEEYERALAVVAGFQKPAAGLQVKIRSLRDAATGKEIVPGSVAKKSTVLFSGIGNPESFARTVRELDVVVKGHRVFPDHHWYGEHDMQTVMADLVGQKAEFLLTTEKDFMRLRGRSGLTAQVNMPLLILEIEQQVLCGKEAMDSFLKQIK
jgi:tetraacyldisaccharide 4'-kinase